MDSKNYSKRIQRNNDYYDFFAPKVKIRSDERDFSKAFDEFLGHADKEKTILDIGCGSGNHLKIFKSKGYMALGIEPSAKMRSLAAEEGDVIDGTFETLDELNLPQIGGIWCASSLLHVPKENIDNVFKMIFSLLDSTAPLYFTVRIGEGSKWDRWDDAEGDISRFIQLFSEQELLDSLEKTGFKNIEYWIEDSYWGRPSKWISVVARKL